MNNFAKNIAVWVIIVLFLVAIFNLFQQKNNDNTAIELAYSEFLTHVENDNVEKVLKQGNNISGQLQTGEYFTTYNSNDPALTERLLKKGIYFVEKPEEGPVSPIIGILLNWLPMLLFIGVWIFFMRQMQGG